MRIRIRKIIPPETERKSCKIGSHFVKEWTKLDQVASDAYSDIIYYRQGRKIEGVVVDHLLGNLLIVVWYMLLTRYYRSFHAIDQEKMECKVPKNTSTQ